MTISVVIPAYNSAGTIAATLDTILAQTTPPLEIIVVDDGSKDETRAALAPYEGRIRAIYQTNGGVSSARNHGVAKASGEWIAFCDADDLWMPEKLRVVASALEAWPDAGVLFHEFSILVQDRIVETHGTHSRRTIFPVFKDYPLTVPKMLPARRTIAPAGVAPGLRTVETYYGDAFQYLMLGNFLLPSTVVVRREIFDAIGGFDATLKSAEDTELFLRLGKATPFVWVDAPLTTYRRASGTLLTSNIRLTIFNSTMAADRHCLQDPEVVRRYGSRVSRAVGHRYARLAYFYLSDLRPAEARGYAWRAIRLNPGQRLPWTVLVASLVPAGLLERIRGRGGKRPAF
jgi:glycosyltransferase involved in cell wall biosynthesis